MIKKLKIIIFGILIIILTLLLNNILAYGAYSLGSKYYSQNNYKVAKKYLKFAQARKPDNADFKDKYIQTLIKLPLDYQTQKELFDISKSDDASPAVIEAYKRLEKFRDTVLSKFKDNYILACVDNYKITRWDEKQFPLKVYIKGNENLTPDKEKLVKKAFNDWDKELKNFFKFKFVNDENEANILVDFDFSLSKDTKNENFYVAAQTYPIITGNQVLKKMIISVNLFDNYGEKLPNDALYATVLHEIGHSLGILGHSNNFEDLMYIRGANNFSQRDLNTIKLLYLIVPQITNAPISEINTKSRIYAPIIIGLDSSMNLEQYNKAITYLQKAPNLSAGWVELATYYYQTKDYPMAIKSFLKAKSLAQNESDITYINSNLGLVYMELKDYSNAILYLEAAQKNGFNPYLKSLESLAKINSGQKEKGLRDLNEIFVHFSDNLDIGFILADVYYSDMNFIGVIKTLKIMKKSNPNFQTDERRNKYKLLNIFV